MINLLWSALGSLGFAFLFNTKRDKLFFCMVSGFLNYAAYFIIFNLTNSIFLSNALGGFIVLIYSSIMAHILKCPATIFVLTGLIPSVPGASIFYMMQNIVLGNNAIAYSFLVETCKVIFGIVFGVAISYTIFLCFNFLKKNES